MPIDVYSTCPGGTGKKIKFCCTDLLAELQKIERMIEGQQFHACLEHIKRLEEKKPGRACLFATKAVLLRELQQWDDLKANVVAFVGKHPDNPVALAEFALATAVTEGGSAALEPLQKALAVSNRELEHRVYETVGVVAHQLALEGNFLAARALFGLQITIDRTDEQALRATIGLNEARNVPLFVKEFKRLDVPPADVAWKKEFEQAMAPAKTGGWSRAAGNLVALAEKVGNSPLLWRERRHASSLVRRRGRLHGGVAEVRGVGCAAGGCFGSGGPGRVSHLGSLGGRKRSMELGIPGGRCGTAPGGFVVVALCRCAAGRSVVARSGRRSAARGTYMICDRPSRPIQGELTIESVQRVVCQLFFFGRETDRDARLEVEGVESRDLEQVKARLAEMAGAELGEAVKQEVAGRISYTTAMLRHASRVPGGVSARTDPPLDAILRRGFSLQPVAEAPLGPSRRQDSGRSGRG